MKLASAEQMRELDRKAIEARHIPSIELMERAAEGIRDAALELAGERPSRCRAAVFCGSGNNGGDGIAAARLLFLSGVKVRTFLVGTYEKLTPDALTMTGRLSECGIQLERFDEQSEEQRNWVSGAHILIDALFGVGLSREILPESHFGTAVDWINRAPGHVVAADIVSGLSADTGRVMGCAVKADRTVTFTLPKLGQYCGEGPALSGEILVKDIGIPAELVRAMGCQAQTTEPALVRESLPVRREDGHKGTFGKLLLVGGSVGFSGAPYLAAEGALRGGCGLVYLGVPASIWQVEAARCVSAMPFPLADKNGMISNKALQTLKNKMKSCDVLALGPGLGRSPEVTRLVCGLLAETEKPVVLDADGINALEGHMDVLEGRRGRVTILTPHDGEFLRAGGNLSAGSRIESAGDFACRYGCVLVLKGHRTVIASPAGNALVNTTGNSGMAKGGSGDILTGLIASLLCQGATPMQAAACGVWLHGRAGDLAAERLTAYAMTPGDIAAELPRAFRQILSEAV